MIHKVILKENDGKRKHIGNYNDKTNTFHCDRAGEKHMLRKYNAWAIDKKLLVEVLVPKEALIVIKDTKNKVEYTINAKDFLEKGTDIEYYNHRVQIYLNKDKFNSRRY